MKKDRQQLLLYENNLYKSENVTLVSMNDGNGLVFTVNDDGSVKVKGTAMAPYEKVIGKVILNKGTYTFTALEGASLHTAYVTANTSPVTYADFGNNTIEITEDNTEVEITLNVLEGAELDVTIYPVIVSGDKAGNYYV